MDMELRALVMKRLDEEIHGDGAERAGLAYTIISGAPKDYAVYRDLCGFVRGLEAAKRIVEDAAHEINQFTATPPTETKPPRKGKSK